MLTRPEQRRRTSFDYMLGSFVYDNIENMKRFVSQEVGDTVVRRKLNLQPDAVIEFVKFYHSTHVSTDEDVLHNTYMAVHGPCIVDPPVSLSKCDSCMIPFEVLGSVDSAVDVPSSHISETVQESKRRIQFYMGCIQRAVNKDRRIADFMDTLRNGTAEKSALTIVDYKIMF